MTTRSRCLALVLLALPLLACGRPVGNLPFSGEGTKTTTMPLAAGNVAFWTNLDVAYEGAATLGYRIELSQAGRTVAMVDCDLLENLSLKLGWLATNYGAVHSTVGHAKMQCVASLPTGGPTVVKATLAFGTRPAKANLKHADLVLKQ